MELPKRLEALKARILDTPDLCIEHAVYMTEAYRETEGKPDVIRRAEALRQILSKMTVHIEPGEILAGWETSKLRAGPVRPEINAGWLLEELDTISTRPHDRHKELSEEEKTTIREVLAYWKDKCLGDQFMHQLPPQYQTINHLATSSFGFSENGHHFAHVAVDYKKLLDRGLNALIEEITAQRDALDMSKMENLHKYHLLDAVLICYDGILTYASRYAAKAEELAAQASGSRREELLRLAQVCRKVPAQPAETFYEAVQSSWFLFIAVIIECWGAGITFGRVDQLWNSYYVHDLEQGIITREEAFEILCSLMLKMNGAVNLQSNMVSSFLSGEPMMQGLTIGGVLPNGEDAVNAMTYLTLDAEEAVGLCGEDIVVRMNDKNPDAYLKRASEVARNLRGKLKFVNDHITISALVNDGIPIEQARDYISTGCHNPTIPAVTHDIGGVTFNYAFPLELALNNGVSRMTGQQLGPKTGDPRTFETFEQLLDAFRIQFRHLIDIAFLYKNIDLSLYAQRPCPLISSFYHGCLERGLDINEGGTLRTHTSSISASPDVGDGLAAIKKLVFEDRVLSMDRLIDALNANYEGYDDVFALVGQAPKFGNNDPYVDQLLREVLAESCDYIREHTTFAGGKSRAGCVTMTANVPFGFGLGATPDGRHAGEPVSEGGISPHQGRNQQGITSTIASVAALDQIRLSHGTILNLRISAECVKDDTSLDKFVAILRTFCALGGNLIQFNFISNEVLRDAQAHPENYRDLLVRVATYSAYFVELSRELQDDIICRNEFAAL